MKDICRRNFMLSCISAYFGLSSFASANSIFSVTKNEWLVNGRLATCDEIIAIAKRHKGIADHVFKDQLLVEKFIEETIQRRNALEIAQKSLLKHIDSAQTSLLVQQISTIAGLVLLTASTVTASPVVVGTALGVQIVGATAVLGFQLVSNKDQGTKLVIGYTKDRTIFFGTTIAESMGSTGGRLLSHSVSILSTAVEFFDIEQNVKNLQYLRDKSEFISQELNYIGKLLARYPPNDKNSWKAMYIRMLQNSSDALISFAEANKSTNCRFPSVGPTLTRP